MRVCCTRAYLWVGGTVFLCKTGVYASLKRTLIAWHLLDLLDAATGLLELVLAKPMRNGAVAMHDRGARADPQG